MSWLKALFAAIGAFFGWLDRKQLMDAGKDAEKGAQAQDTLDLVKDVRRPITGAERDGVWHRLKEQRARERGVPTDPGT